MSREAFRLDMLTDPVNGLTTLVVLAFVILSFLWWPTALAPAWYRNWARRVRADPATWLERTARTSTARSQEIGEAAGVTRDMDAIQRALRIKEHRKQEKAARRAAGHDRS